jgi:hypothetical protein
MFENIDIMFDRFRLVMFHDHFTIIYECGMEMNGVHHYTYNKPTSISAALKMLSNEDKIHLLGEHVKTRDGKWILANF